MNKVYFFFEDGTIAQYDVLGSVRGLKRKCKRPVKATLYVSNDIYYNNETFNEWVNKVVVPALPPKYISEDLNIYRVEE